MEQKCRAQEPKILADDREHEEGTVFSMTMNDVISLIVFMMVFASGVCVKVICMLDSFQKNLFTLLIDFFFSSSWI